MRLDSAHQHRVAIDVEVLRRDRRGDLRAGRFHKVDSVRGGDVFKHHPQLREGSNNRPQVPVYKFFFTVEHVDIMIGDLAVDTQYDGLGLHPREHGVEVFDVRHTRRRIGGGVGGIHLGRGEHPLGRAAREIIGIGGVGEVAGHQRGKAHAFGHSGQNPVPVGRAQRRGRHRRGEIGHYDGTRKLARSVGHHLAHDVAIAEMQVPVIGAADREAVGHVFPLAMSDPICHA